MVDIFPFKGTRYNLEKLAQQGHSLADVVTPPYDVIDLAQQQVFIKKHPANFVHVDFNPKTELDTPQNNVYTRAAECLNRWEADQTIVAETAPSVYAYSQCWQEVSKEALKPGENEEENFRMIERKGAVVLLRLESFESGQVLPHEYTLKGPKQDRLDLMRSTQCNLSQIFMIYSDPEQVLESLLYNPSASNASNWASVTDADGVNHQFCPISDLAVIESLQKLFKDKPLLIADGHHRYETALVYQQEVREQLRKETGTEPPAGSLLSDYCMVFLTNMDDPGLKVYPTHRIMHHWPEGFTAESFEVALLTKFDVLKDDEPEATLTYRTGTAASPVLRRLKLKPQAQPKHLPSLLDTFDAAILEEVVFKALLGTTGEALKQNHTMGFYRNEAEIEALWQAKEAVAGFYLGTPSVKLVHQICEAGHRMPQKSTYFYPKILSGLVTYLYRNFANTQQNALSGVNNLVVRPVPATTSKPITV
jgi:uncharacterized protein (DUF1015 family)